jgi:cytochrome c biogenesis protein CcmG, thiol:disulfide interchange protein DsbE
MRALVNCCVAVCISAIAPVPTASAPARPITAKQEGAIWLGVVFHANTPRVQSVIVDSPAAKAGLRAGDRLISIGGTTIVHAEDVSRAMAQCKIGARFDVVLERGRERITVSVTAATRPNPADVQRTALVGKPAPNVQLPTLDGSTIRLESLRGRVVVLDFWATWCVPCVAALPHLNEWHQRLGAKGLVVIGITQESADEVRAFLAEGQTVAYPIALDATAEALGRYRVQGLPLTVIIDKKGVIRSAEIGVGELGVMEGKLTSLLR